MSTISIQNLTKRYGPVLAVDSLSFDVGPGRVTGFTGPNGSGKPVTELGHSLLSCQADCLSPRRPR